jgi:RNA polymerase primary sigma factor
MAKAKDIAKEAPKARISKAKEKAAEKALLEGAMAETPQPLDAEARKMRLKALIKLGKERGYLTYAEINDHLPDDVVDAESIEAIISTFSEMSIQVFDEAPAAEDLLMSDTAAAATDDEEVEAQAEQALSTVDSEFGRTTDPVRMYMREMGSVELLTREGEIEIAKRIEEGLKHMIQAISACPTTIADILEVAAKVEADEMRIDELIDGLIDPNAVEAGTGTGSRQRRATKTKTRKSKKSRRGWRRCCRIAAATETDGIARFRPSGRSMPRCRKCLAARARKTRPTSSCNSNFPTN